MYSTLLVYLIITQDKSKYFSLCPGNGTRQLKTLHPMDKRELKKCSACRQGLVAPKLQLLKPIEYPGKCLKREDVKLCR